MHKVVAKSELFEIDGDVYQLFQKNHRRKSRKLKTFKVRVAHNVQPS